MTKLTKNDTVTTPDGVVMGKDIPFYFWLGADGEKFVDATPEEIEAVDAMFTEPPSGTTGVGDGCAQLGAMDQHSFDWTGLGGR